MHDLVRSLGTSHTGFFHLSARRVPARIAIGATFGKLQTSDGPRWAAQDVHEGGPAQKAGLARMDFLESIDGRPIAPPDPVTFGMETEPQLVVKRGAAEVKLRVTIPQPRSRTRPVSELKPVVRTRHENGVGYVKVSVLPGLLGLDVARQIDAAFRELDSCDRLILDLRGHVGGGLGVLRLMSHLTPDALPIGYTVTRKRVESGYDKASLPKLGKLPTHLPNALAIASLAIRFGRRDPSVLLVSEGLGPKRWHGRVAIVINEHTIGAGEMIAAFAKENGLATIVGTETAGRLAPGSSYKLDHGYILVVPKAQYITWQGQRFEGAGIKPDLETIWSPKAPGRVADSQLDAAVGVLSIA